METVTLICSYCGRPCLENAIVSANPIANAEPAWFIMCPQCFSVTKTCIMCKEAHNCDFETNPDPSPKQIKQTIRQGQITMQMSVRNPDRIEKTCKLNCKCFDEELGCLKQNGTCGQYEEVIPE